MKQELFEYKHTECSHDTELVNAVLKIYELFYWQLVQTQTVVSKESHLQSTSPFLSHIISPGDTVESVTTEERFVTLNLKRSRDIPNLDQVKTVENEYFNVINQLGRIGCSPIGNFSDSPVNPSVGLVDFFCLDFRPPWTRWKDFREYGLLAGISPKVAKKKRSYAERLKTHQELKSRLDQIADDNKHILNL